MSNVQAQGNGDILDLTDEPIAPANGHAAPETAPPVAARDPMAELMGLEVSPAVSPINGAATQAQLPQGKL